jgi:hypothetical protein
MTLIAGIAIACGFATAIFVGVANLLADYVEAPSNLPPAIARYR